MYYGLNLNWIHSFIVSWNFFFIPGWTFIGNITQQVWNKISCHGQPWASLCQVCKSRENDGTLQATTAWSLLYWWGQTPGEGNPLWNFEELAKLLLKIEERCSLYFGINNICKKLCTFVLIFMLLDVCCGKFNF